MYNMYISVLMYYVMDRSTTALEHNCTQTTVFCSISRIISCRSQCILVYYALNPIVRVDSFSRAICTSKFYKT